MQRSDSSAPLRNYLKENLASLPQISNKVSLNSYIRLTRNLYYGALSAYKNGDLRRTYIDLYKFQILALQRIPTHKDYSAKSALPSDAKRWLNEARLPALKILEEVVCKLDLEEDRRIKHAQEYDLIDEFDNDDGEAEDAAVAAAEANQYYAISSAAASAALVEASSSATASTGNQTKVDASAMQRDFDKLSILRLTPASTVAESTNTGSVSKSNNNATTVFTSIPSSLPSGVTSSISCDVPDIQSGSFEDEDEDDERTTAIIPTAPTAPTAPAASSTALLPPPTGKLTGSGIHLPKAAVDVVKYLGNYRRFAIPQPSTTPIEIRLGEPGTQLSPCSSSSYHFWQDDFHISFAGFLLHLPVELQMSRSAVEMNRCFFIHLGIALNIHPFALQTALRMLSASALATAADWEKDILDTVNQYSGFVDANALLFLWPREFSAFRLCFISGPLTRPLVSVFEPPASSGSDREKLVEVLIRCSGDHFTLLRPRGPTAAAAGGGGGGGGGAAGAGGGGGTGGGGGGGFRVISRLVRDAQAAKLVTQVAEARSETSSLQEVLQRVV